MRRLVWASAGRTYHIVGNIMHWFNFKLCQCWLIFRAFLLIHEYVCWVIFKINYFEKFFQKYHQSIKQFGSRSGSMFHGTWSGSKLFAKVISRGQNSSQTLTPTLFSCPENVICFWPLLHIFIQSLQTRIFHELKQTIWTLQSVWYWSILFAILATLVVFPTAWKKGRVLARKGHIWCVKFTQKGTFVRADFSNVS